MAAVILALLLAGQAAQQTPPAKPTIQQSFDEATKAAVEGRCEEAIRIFESIETAPKIARNAMVRAAIDVRKGGCLIELGRLDEGEAAVRRGLPALAGKGEDFAEEVRQSHLALGRLGAQRFDYVTAVAEYKQALDGATGKGRLRPLLALSQVLAFDQDGQALRYATEARTLALADATVNKRELATVQTQYARVLLNQGRQKEAYAELKDSLRKQGGLDFRVNLDDITTRSDLAIAASLNKDHDAARKYLAYTGAGRFKDTPFDRATSMEPPLCGSATGLKPEDFAIVEFSLAEDGHVRGAMPIYVTGGRDAALAFARAVAGWSWQPEAVKAVPPLFRYATRVEIRCTVAGERPPLTAPLAEAYAEWMESLGKPEPGWTDQPAAKAAPLQRAALAQARAAGDRPGELAALFALGNNSVIGEPERRGLLGEGVALADALKAPPPARIYVAIPQVWAKSDDGREAREMLRALLARPEVAGDPLAAATLRLLIAAPSFRTPAPSDSETLLAAVIAEPELPAQHPLKVAALLQQANRFASKGDVEGAQRLFEQTGLTTEQCAFLGLQPAMRRPGTSSEDYPTDAYQMGFEGWVRTEFDVATDGSTIRPRVLTAYPPFVFDEAGAKISKGFRYTASYRPKGSVACTGRQEAIKFLLP
ncbi:hypothetical protein E5A73_13515 [Sphingomonas gei]|uniref:TonB C-terminal domain-containing protein n=1 Tax=Sphingomonas gei TaxID=1395960 RepID=A0A4V3QZ37_9SPHN|nr:energy transducer TonB [Sphingomonas gei]TGX52662.1 hypothetical protein E5A73_13515 [Sphingomonas gei]